MSAPRIGILAKISKASLFGGVGGGEGLEKKMGEFFQNGCGQKKFCHPLGTLGLDRGPGLENSWQGSNRLSPCALRLQP